MARHPRCSEPPASGEDPGFVRTRTPKEREARERRGRRASLLSALREVQDRMRRFGEGDETAWDDAGPMVLVGLFVFLHTTVYGVSPGELDEGKTLLAAASAARRLITDLGSPVAVVEFVRWTWARERTRMRRRQSAPDESPWRISWRWQFASRQLLTDYRVAVARTGQVR